VGFNGPKYETPQPPPPPPRTLTAQEFFGSWDTPAFEREEPLITYANRIRATGKDDDPNRLGATWIKRESQITEIEIDKKLHLKMIVYTTMTVTADVDPDKSGSYPYWSGYVRGYIVNNWPERDKYPPSYTNAPPYIITGMEVIEKDLKYEDVKKMIKNGEISEDGNSITLLADDVRSLYSLRATGNKPISEACFGYDIDDPLVFSRQDFKVPSLEEWDTYRIPTLADLSGTWYTQFEREPETVREFLERRAEWSNAYNALRDMSISAKQDMTMVVNAAEAQRHINTTLFIHPASDGSYPYYTNFRGAIVNQWPKPCVPMYNDSKHTVTGWEEDTVQLDLGRLTAGGTGTGMRISADGRKLWLPEAAAAIFYEPGCPVIIFSKR
jgi:hypothetical protein